MIVIGRDREIAEWVGQRLKTNFVEFRAIGLAYRGKLIAGVVYHNYRPPKNIEMSIASDSPRWATRSSLNVFFSYPFQQLGCSRVTAITDAGATHTRNFLERLGFVQEGLLRDGNPEDDAVIYGLLKRECRWIHGKERLRSAPSARP